MTICPIASNCLEFSLATGQLYLLHAISRRRTFSFGSNFFSARTTWAIIFYDNSYTIYRPLHTIHNSFVTMTKRNKNSFQIVYNFSFCKIAFGCSVYLCVCMKATRNTLSTMQGKKNDRFTIYNILLVLTHTNTKYFISHIIYFFSTQCACARVCVCIRAEWKMAKLWLTHRRKAQITFESSHTRARA